MYIVLSGILIFMQFDPTAFYLCFTALPRAIIVTSLSRSNGAKVRQRVYLVYTARTSRCSTAQASVCGLITEYDR